MLAGDPWARAPFLDAADGTGTECNSISSSPRSIIRSRTPQRSHPIWQSDAKRGRVLPYGDLAVVKLRTYYRTGSTFKGDLVHL